MKSAFATKPAINPMPHPDGTLGFRGARPRLQPVSTLSSPPTCGEIKPTPLPYAREAMAPHLSRETMEYHYDKHFIGYVNKLNGLIRDTEYATMGLEDMIRQAAWRRKRAILSNAAQVWNHAFFWKSMSLEEGQTPDVILSEAITKQFGSLSAFHDKFVEKGASHLGSGWLWLAWEKQRGLVIATTSNATPVWLGTDRAPLLVCDLWEHAYYIDWRDDRAGWLGAFIMERANWTFVGEQMAALIKGEPQWAYPNI